MFGYIYNINDGISEKRVSPDQLEEYLHNGWKMGRINNYFPNGNSHKM